MPNNTVSDWSTTPASNTEVGGVDLAENSMRPRDVNNAIRTMMAQIATGIDNSEFGGIAAASTTEVLTGTNSTKAVTPDALAALWEKGGDIASAATISVGEGGLFHVTGTTGITDIDFATATNGRAVWIEFDGILTLTHNATTMNLPGSANITTAAGDRMLVAQDSGDNVHVLVYQRADGTPLVTVPVAKGGTGAATLTANNVILGNGTSAVQFVAPSTSGNVLTSNGTTWQSTAPSSSGQPIPTSSSFAVGTLLLCALTSGSVADGATVAGSSLKSAYGTGTLGTGGGAQTGTWTNRSGATVNSGGNLYGYFSRTA